MRRIVILPLVLAVAACGGTASPSPAAVPAPVATPAAVAATPLVIYVTPEPQVVAPDPTEAVVAPAVEETAAPVAGAVKLGTWATVGDWKIRFTKTNSNAWKAVHAANMFNDAPEPGYQMVMSWVEYQYLGTGREALDPMFTFRAVGNGGIEYSQFEDPTCGVLPKPDVAMTDPTLRHNGKAKGWVCWQVEKADVKSLTAFTSFFSDFDDGLIAEFKLR